MQATNRLPVTVIGGYLGAGKTTLVNHLLRHAAGRRIAVMVNDFGALPIDADLIEARDGDLLAIAGGCVCCSYGSDMMDALARLLARTPRPDHLVIETSGVALPGSVARSVALLADLRVDGVVVLADANDVRERAADRYMADTILRQLAEADLLLLAKTDLVGADTLAALDAWLAETAPRARRLAAVRGALPVEVLLGEHHAPPPGASGSLFYGSAMRPLHDSTALFSSASREPAGHFDLDALLAALADPALDLVRAKGLLRDAAGRMRVLHLAGGRGEIGDAPPGYAGGPKLVCISRAPGPDAARLDHVLKRCLTDA